MATKTPTQRASEKRWRLKNPEKVRLRLRRNLLRRNYGITIETYEAMLAAQGGKCVICKAHPLARKLAVDHCHTTGKVRGLLCFRCNTVLGKVYDDAMLLRALADYISSNGQ